MRGCLAVLLIRVALRSGLGAGTANPVEQRAASNQIGGIETLGKSCMRGSENGSSGFRPTFP
jgi:hypothetical protein